MKIYFESLEFEIFEDVYPPSEESFLLAKYAKSLAGRILDMGCGSGFLSIINAHKNPENEVFGADISMRAVENAQLNAKKNNVKNCKFLQSDLFSKARGKFNWIVSNPPYLPTGKREKLKKPLNYAFDGGIDGRKVIDRFIGKVGDYLVDGGGVIMLDSSLDKTDVSIMMLQYRGFEVEVLDKEHIFFEDLSILKAVKIV